MINHLYVARNQTKIPPVLLGNGITQSEGAPGTFQIFSDNRAEFDAAPILSQSRERKLIALVSYV